MGVPTDGGAAHRLGWHPQTGVVAPIVGGCTHPLRTQLYQGSRPRFQALSCSPSHGLPLPHHTPTSQHGHTRPCRVEKLPWTLPCFRKDYRGLDEGGARLVTRAQLGTGTPRLQVP